MTNEYIEVELSPNSYGGGSFTCKASFHLDILGLNFNDITVKIDTGCTLSTIPVKKLNIPEYECRKLKRTDIINNIINVESYGTETGGLPHPKPNTIQEKMDCPGLKFQHSISNLLLNGVTIPNQTIFLNYDRSGNILIGMDILKQLTCHWDISEKTGKLTLLSCPRGTKSKEFWKAMMEHFKLVKI